MTEFQPIDEEHYEPPPGTAPGRILVRVLGQNDRYPRWETEVLDYDNDTAVFWINEGVGFEYFFDARIDFPGEGVWVINDITVSWTRGDGWSTDDDEDWDWGEIRPATPEEIATAALENQKHDPSDL
jgi:hypothetical protein